MGAVPEAASRIRSLSRRPQVMINTPLGAPHTQAPLRRAGLPRNPRRAELAPRAPLYARQSRGAIARGMLSWQLKSAASPVGRPSWLAGCGG
jgi:hypothetical protein